MLRFFLSMLATVLILLSERSLAENLPTLSIEDEINAGDALFASFKKSRGFADTAQTLRLEEYLQQVGNKVAANAGRKLTYKFHLDPHPAFRSAVAYPGGHIVVGGGVLALMGSEDQLAMVLGHEIGHISLDQCVTRLREAMQKHNLTVKQFDQLSFVEFGGPYGKKGELDADREGMRMAVAAGYSSKAMVNLLETFQVLYRNPKPAPRADAPSLEERAQQAIEEIEKNKWENSPDQRPLRLR